MPVAQPHLTSVDLDGSWTRRDVSANGIRLHIAECLPPQWRDSQVLGSLPPLILFVHGHAEMWWVWHNQLTALAAAGYHTVAVDLRGYGNSDKPPRGYDPWTASGDLAGLIRAIGHRTAIIVAHGIGGYLSWTLARIYPSMVQRLILLSGPHPRSLRRQIFFSHAQRRGISSMLYAPQIPRLAEYLMRKNEAQRVENFVRKGSSPGFRGTPEEVQASSVLRSAMLIHPVAHSANEYARWLFRANFSPDGARYFPQMAYRIIAPVTQIQGAHNPYIVTKTLTLAERWTHSHRMIFIEDAGFFTQLETPDTVNRIILETLSNPPDQA